MDAAQARSLALIRWTTLAEVWAAYRRFGRGVAFEHWMTEVMGRADADLSALERSGPTAARRG